MSHTIKAVRIGLLVILPLMFADRANGQFSPNTFGGDAAPPPRSSGLGGFSSQSSASQSTIPTIVLREGTVIGPIRGRLVLRGQRWWFIVEERPQTDGGHLADMIDTGSARTITEKKSTILKRNTTVTKSGTFTQSRHEQRMIDDERVGRVHSEGQIQRRVLLPPFESMIVVENLMLGRIASAVEADPADDHWTITGRITEFQNDNRLILATAHRTVSSNTP